MAMMMIRRMKEDRSNSYSYGTSSRRDLGLIIFHATTYSLAIYDTYLVESPNLMKHSHSQSSGVTSLAYIVRAHPSMERGFGVRK
eukprot:scaffold6905_cov80-Skeletonema_marinoi.AAC.1